MSADNVIWGRLSKIFLQYTKYRLATVVILAADVPPGHPNSEEDLS